MCFRGSGRPKCHISCEMWQSYNRDFYNDFQSNAAFKNNLKNMQIDTTHHKALVFTSINSNNIPSIWNTNINLSCPKPVNTLFFPATLMTRLFEDQCSGFPRPVAIQPNTQRFTYNYDAKLRAKCQGTRASMFVLADMVSLGLRDICLRNATILIDSKLSSRTWELLKSLLRQLEMYFNALISIDICCHISLVEYHLCWCYVCSSTASSVGIPARRAQQNPRPEPCRAYLQRSASASRLLGDFPSRPCILWQYGPPGWLRTNFWVRMECGLSADGVRKCCLGPPSSTPSCQEPDLVAFGWVRLRRPEKLALYCSWWNRVGDLGRQFWLVFYSHLVPWGRSAIVFGCSLQNLSTWFCIVFSGHSVAPVPVWRQPLNLVTN